MELIIHYVNYEYSDESPCGDDDLEAPVSDDPTHVTCKGCLRYIKNVHKK